MKTENKKAETLIEFLKREGFVVDRLWYNGGGSFDARVRYPSEEKGYGVLTFWSVDENGVQEL